MEPISLHDFPLQSFDKIRYADTDRQGHVNNAVFSTFFETGRAELLYTVNENLIPENTSYVIAALNMNYIKEVCWPGKVEIGTGILRIGNSSLRIFQQLFQNDVLVADAETVIVQVDDRTGKSKLLSDYSKGLLKGFLLEENKVLIR
jgi:acyl-CoA thioester hydrolase